MDFGEQHMESAVSITPRFVISGRSDFGMTPARDRLVTKILKGLPPFSCI